MLSISSFFRTVFENYAASDLKSVYFYDKTKNYLWGFREFDEILRTSQPIMGRLDVILCNIYFQRLSRVLIGLLSMAWYQFEDHLFY